MTQDQFNDKVAQVADSAARYIRTGMGQISLANSFNELAESSGANLGINQECTIGRRKLLVSKICIDCISRLSKGELQHAESVLNEIAENYEQPRRRGLHR